MCAATTWTTTARSAATAWPSFACWNTWQARGLPSSMPTTRWPRGYLSQIDGPVLTVGMHHEAEITATMIERSASEQTMLLAAGSDVIPVRTRMIGVHHAYNCLTAAAVGLAYGIDLPTVVRGLEAIDYVPGRLETDRVRPAVRRLRRLRPHARRTDRRARYAPRSGRRPRDLRLRCGGRAGPGEASADGPGRGETRRPGGHHRLTIRGPKTPGNHRGNSRRLENAGRSRSHSRSQRGDRLGPVPGPAGDCVVIAGKGHETARSSAINVTTSTTGRSPAVALQQPGRRGVGGTMSTLYDLQQATGGQLKTPAESSGKRALPCPSG